MVESEEFFTLGQGSILVRALRPKGLDPMVESEEFFTVGQGSILVRALPGAMGTP
jgi:hypothetical protein